MKKQTRFHAIGIGIFLIFLAARATMSPRSHLWGPIFDHASRKSPYVAITFDDGPNEPYTSEILAVLKRYHVRATFFLIGENALTYPGTVRKILADGNEIGNHTFSHPHLPDERGSAILWQIDHTEDVLDQISGVRPIWFRPPYGFRDPRLFPKTHREGLRVVEWSNMPRDWTRPGTKVIVKRTLEHLKPGDIILLHDGDNTIHGGDRSQTVAALPAIIQGIEARGLTPVTISQLAESTRRKKYIRFLEAHRDLEPLPPVSDG